MADDATPAADAARPDATAPEPAPRSPAPGCLLIAFLAAGAGMLAIYLALRPDGDAMGHLDLQDSTASLAVEGAAGDALTFVADVTTGLDAYSGSSWKQRSNAAVDAMKSSTLTVRVTSPDGREETASCALWGGSMSSDRLDDEGLTENGVINDCRIVLAADGKHDVTVGARWTDSLAIRAARLTVYRERR